MDVTTEAIDRVRRFTRFYTRRIGVLQEGLLGSRFSLTEARVVYELAQRDGVTAAELGKELGLDAGYLSRILRGFADAGLIVRAPSRHDARQSLIALTSEGRAAFAEIDARSRNEVAAMLARLAEPDRTRLVAAMCSVEDLLASEPARARAPQADCVLRPHRPGDMGFVIHRQAVLYHQEYGWDESFEALVAEICAGFIKSFEPGRERCWIAEIDGEIVGSVFLVRQSDEIAKLRLLYVEPKARGLGLGQRLVRACIGFAREAGYAQLTLWTNDILHAARQIYVAEGFRLVAEEKHHSFGHDLVGQNWALDLVRGEAGT
jgi:DNA-binding MarR family transcriptional regulator/ribosomal protein S18 acetylase RimI-like enzyme